jgi:hypothetical protein
MAKASNQKSDLSKSKLDKSQDSAVLAFLEAIGLLRRTWHVARDRVTQHAARAPLIGQSLDPNFMSAPPHLIAEARAMGVILSDLTTQAEAEALLAWLRNPNDLAAAAAVPFPALTRLRFAHAYWEEEHDHPLWRALQNEYDRRNPGYVASGAAIGERQMRGLADMGKAFNARMDKLKADNPAEYARVVAKMRADDIAADERLRRSDPFEWAHHNYHVNIALLRRGADPKRLRGPIEPGLPIARIAVTPYPRRGHTATTSLALH